MFRTSIDAWHDGDLDLGRRACEHILSRPDIPDTVRHQSLSNLRYYARQLAELAPDVRFTALPRLTAPEASWFNPSIAVDGEGTHVLVRSSNYVIAPSGGYASFDPDKVIRSRTYSLRLDGDLNLRELAPITDTTPSLPRFPTGVTGFEDARLVAFDGNWYTTATARDLNPAATCQQVLLRLHGHAWTTCHPLSSPADGHQKNWMPFVSRGELLVVSHCHPVTILRIDPARGDVHTLHSHESTPLATSFRGGSQGVPIDGGMLFVVHEVADTPRTYLHRFILIDHDYQLTHISPQFRFTNRNIEFCAGMARVDDDLLLSFGVEDAEAWIARVPLDQVIGALQHVDEYHIAPDIPLHRELHVPATERNGLVSVTLAGKGTEDMVADALRSVIDQVDTCLLIDTGIGEAGVAVAREVAGERLRVRTLAWPNDFAAARNAALQFAAESGAQWAITLDTDERLHFGDTNLRRHLSSFEHDVLSVASSSGTYAKPRIFRLPATGAWVGATHEYFDRRSSTEGTLPGATFHEIEKSADRLRAKLTRDVGILIAMTGREPREARWWYYLGDTYSNLGDHAQAIAAFDRCASLDGWHEEAAWARYREAECWLALGLPARAVERCAAGLARYPGMAELAWLAGFASWTARRYEDAVRWAELAIVHGETGTSGAARRRIGFRNPAALNEGPYDILRFAWRELGNAEAASEAERRYQEIRSERLGESSFHTW